MNIDHKPLEEALEQVGRLEAAEQQTAAIVSGLPLSVQLRQLAEAKRRTVSALQVAASHATERGR